MFNLINNSPRLVFVPKANHAMVPIPPGASREVNISAAMAKHLRKCQLRGSPGAIKVEGLTDEDRAMLDEVKAGRPADSDPLPSERQSEEPRAASRSAALLAKIDDISFPQFRAEAKEILGDRFPAGHPGKEELVELLQGN